MKLRKATFDCGVQGWWSYCKQLDPTVLQLMQEFYSTSHDFLDMSFFPKPQSMTTKTFFAHSLGVLWCSHKKRNGREDKEEKVPPNFQTEMVLLGANSVGETKQHLKEVIAVNVNSFSLFPSAKVMFSLILRLWYW